MECRVVHEVQTAIVEGLHKMLNFSGSFNFKYDQVYMHMFFECSFSNPPPVSKVSKFATVTTATTMVTCRVVMRVCRNGEPAVEPISQDRRATHTEPCVL